MSKRLLLAALCVLCCASTVSLAQVLRVAELSSRDLQKLNRDRTVVMIPGGIFEQHGPYLPSFTDGYLNEWIAHHTAEAIVAERGLVVLIFPTIPLGVGSPEDFGGLSPFSGSYALRPETLRAVYMDLVSALGQDGFRTIFVVNRHGAPAHNRSLLDAAEYFEARPADFVPDLQFYGWTWFSRLQSREHPRRRDRLNAVRRLDEGASPSILVDMAAEAVCLLDPEAM